MGESGTYVGILTNTLGNIRDLGVRKENKLLQNLHI